MFKRDIWCLDQCSAFKPSSLNKINCGDAGLAVCGVTMGGEGCTPLPRLVHMKYLAVVTGSHCDFIGGLERPTSPVRTQYSDCHLSSHITLGLFLLTPQHHGWIMSQCSVLLIFLVSSEPSVRPLEEPASEDFLIMNLLNGPVIPPGEMGKQRDRLIQSSCLPTFSSN